MLEDNAWAIEPPEIIELKNKILSKGTPIKDIHDIKINYGIKTGYNKAFIIDEETKNQLIEEDPKNSDIIKPILRGRDIKKWILNYQKLYLLYIPWQLKISEFPSIKEYLSQFKDNLSKRPEVKKGRYPWYALSRYASDYYQEMENNKIIYQEIVAHPKFFYDENNYYVEASAFLLTSSKLNMKALTALLNSNVLFFILKRLCTTLSSTGFRYKKIFMEQMPIINLSEKSELKLSQYTDELQLLYQKNNKKLIKEKEYELNYLIYELYGLNPEECKLIEKDLNEIN